MDELMDIFPSRACRQCKKNFYVFNLNKWAYKIRYKSRDFDYFCSWRCLRAFEQEHKIRGRVRDYA